MIQMKSYWTFKKNKFQQQTDNSCASKRPIRSS